MPVCYRVSDWSLQQFPNIRVSLTNSNAAEHLAAVMGVSFPGLRVRLESQDINLDSFTFEQGYRLEGTLPEQHEISAFLESSKVAISVIDGCDTSFCLDMYRLPAEEDESPEEWHYTPIGFSVFRAKYRSSSADSKLVAEALLAGVQRHKALQRATTIVAMPSSSDHGSRPDCPRAWAGTLASALGIDVMAVTRVRDASSQKNFVDLDQRKANQHGSMSAPAEVRGQSILVVDDLYMLGDSVREIARALRGGRCCQVFSICAAKTAKGCQGYSF